MNLLIWQDTDSVGVKELDNQHQEIFSISNRLYDLINQSQKKEDFIAVLNELNNHVSQHFSTEEKYFDLYQYDQGIFHTKLHQFYSQRMDDFLKKIEENFTPDLILEMTNFMKIWWINHIDIEDKKYSQYFNQQGLY